MFSQPCPTPSRCAPTAALSLAGEAQYGVISNSGFSYTAVWRTKLNVTVVRMNKQRTGYYVEPRLYNNPLTSWTVVDAPFIPLPNA